MQCALPCGCITLLLSCLHTTAMQPMTLPVVRMARGGKSVTLLARSVDEYLHRWVEMCKMTYIRIALIYLSRIYIEGEGK